MSTNLFLTVINGITRRVQAIAASVGTADANKIVATGSNGRIDTSLMPTNPTFSSVTFNNGVNPSFSIAPYTEGAETGLSVPVLRCSGGRFDFNPADNKAEFRVTGANTQFNIYNTTLFGFYLTINSDRSVQMFGTTESTSRTTGALTIPGGVGITRNLFAKQLFADVASTSNTTPAIIGFTGQASGTFSRVDVYDSATGLGSGWGQRMYISSWHGIDIFGATTGSLTQAQLYSGGSGTSDHCVRIAGTSTAHGSVLRLEGVSAATNPLIRGFRGAAQVFSVAATGEVTAPNLLYNVISNTVPSSPTNGLRWLEVDAGGLPIEGWYYDATNTRWVSLDAYATGTSVSNISASTTNRFDFSVPGTYTGLLLTRIFHRVVSTSAHSGSNVWTMTIGTYVNNSTTQISGTASLTTNGLAANTDATYAENVSIAVSTGISFTATYNRGGTAANLWASTILTFRKIR